MAMKTIGVVGCGLMGSGIAQVSAGAGLTTWVCRWIRGPSTRARPHPQVPRGRRHQGKGHRRTATALGNIKGTLKLDRLASCELVIEAAIENLGGEAAGLLGPGRGRGSDAVLSSNTSSLSIPEIAARTRRPDSGAGSSTFFNPVPLMKLVEIIRALTTSDAAFARAQEYVQQIRKTPVVCQDTPGFVVNRLLVPYLLDAVRVYEVRIASKRTSTTA